LQKSEAFSGWSTYRGLTPATEREDGLLLICAFAAA
jgi:hypothetical protein